MIIFNPFNKLNSQTMSTKNQISVEIPETVISDVNKKLQECISSCSLFAGIDRRRKKISLQDG